MIAVVALALGILLSPPPPETVRAAVKAIREDATYQKTLPPPARAIEPRGGDDSGESGGRRARRGDGEDDESDGKGGTIHRRRRRTAAGGDPRDPREPLPTFELPEIAIVIFWVVAGVFILVLVVALVRAFLGRDRTPKEKKAAAPAARGAASAVPAIAFDDADRLAQEGRYAEAIHVLLLRTLASLAERGTGLADSWTSREVVRDAPLAAEARGMLSGIVDAVEVSRFGFVVPDAAAYAECRARFERLAAVPARAGAA